MTEIDLVWRLHPFQGLVGAVPGTGSPGGLTFGASRAGQIADKAPPSAVPAFSSFVVHFLSAKVVAVWCPSRSGCRLSLRGTGGHGADRPDDEPDLWDCQNISPLGHWHMCNHVRGQGASSTCLVTCASAFAGSFFAFFFCLQHSGCDSWGFRHLASSLDINPLSRTSDGVQGCDESSSEN